MAVRRFLSGNEAIALGAVEAGVAVAAGYPGTPSTEILETLAGTPGIWVQWSPNEKVALEVGSGASMTGARVLVTMKHVGLNVAADPLFTLSYTGVTGGLVIVTADDPQLHSSQNEQDNRHYARHAKVPVLEPSDSSEARELLLAAYEISERFDTPVLFRTTTRIAHTKGVVEPGEALARAAVKVPDKNPSKLVMVPAHGARRHVVVEERTLRLAEFAESFAGNRLEPGSPDLGIVAAGVAYQHAREALPEASFLKLGMTWPLPMGLIRRFAAGVKRLVVVEELDPFFEEQIRAAGIPVSGKDILPVVGELNSTIIAAALGRPIPAGAAANVPAVPNRPPILCPGCPHRGVFHLLGRRKYFVTGDIGCYTLAAVPPLAALDTCLCMGASIGQALGIEKALGEDVKPKVAAVIGDSTFFHSGITPLLDVVHNGGKTTVIVLDNRTTAMTGRQDNPGNESNLMGLPVPAVQVADIARAAGIPTVLITDAFDLAGIGRALDEAQASAGASVIVNRGPCVLLTKGQDRPPFTVLPAVCRGCRLCHSVGCPAIGWRTGVANALGRDGVTVIDDLLCNGCSVCAQVCPFGAIVSSVAGEGSRP